MIDKFLISSYLVVFLYIYFGTISCFNNTFFKSTTGIKTFEILKWHDKIPPPHTHTCCFIFCSCNDLMSLAAGFLFQYQEWHHILHPNADTHTQTHTNAHNIRSLFSYYIRPHKSTPAIMELLFLLVAWINSYIIYLLLAITRLNPRLFMLH